MQASNPMEAILLQQQQAKQEAEAAGLDFNSMVRDVYREMAVVVVCVFSYGMNDST